MRSACRAISAAARWRWLVVAVPLAELGREARAAAGAGAALHRRQLPAAFVRLPGFVQDLATLHAIRDPDPTVFPLVLLSPGRQSTAGLLQLDGAAVDGADAVDGRVRVVVVAILVGDGDGLVLFEPEAARCGSPTPNRRNCVVSLGFPRH